MQAPGPRLKRYLPRSLFGRALMILVLPILFLQGVVTTVLVTRHYESVTLQMSSGVARELDYLVDQVESAPALLQARLLLANVGPPLRIAFRLDAGADDLPPSNPPGFWDFTGHVIDETVTSGIERPVTLDLASTDKAVIMHILTSRGTLTATVPRRQMNPANPHQLIIVTTLVAIGLVAVALIFLRNQMRPIRELARAAQDFGRGRATFLRPSGAEEIRSAGHAFLEMRNRLERQIQSRTAMLSGVSHDLRTPLTRMKLSLAMMPEDDESRALGREVVEMERMLESFLAFARGEAGEEAAPTDLVMLIEEIAAEAERLGTRPSVATDHENAASPIVSVRRDFLKRALVNLVENARRYGGRISLTLRLARRTADIVIEDDGPGIPEHRREEMLRPFTRLDPARGQDAGGGTGLGLSIALEAARAHGGTLELDESPRFGGLRATLRLPR
ncbi:MAG: ATP-binding protein [Pseudomonadota bacterium]